MGLKFMGLGRSKKGYTLIELLIVAAIIGILLAIAIPNLIKARISANEANARKAMQALRDAEAEFFEQDLDNNGSRDFTDLIGVALADNSLRCPDSTIVGGCTEQDALVDNSFVGAIAGVDGTTPANANCTDTKAGYCIGWTGDAGPPDIGGASYGDAILEADFGWEASMTSALKNGRRDFGVWGDGVIRCSTTTAPAGAGNPGTFQTSRDAGHGACD